jgi:predicted dehydrogenase/threonine dehydrogenase-like Zn-dependent dehydrogenase
MKQVVQSFKTGDLEVKEVPAPILQKKYVLVENKTSLISAGTERGTVKVAQANLLNKAKQRPDLVKQVFQNLKKEGFKATFDKVRTKLDSPKALGYSTAGVVTASLDSSNRFKPGDRIACAGQDLASHAEIVAIPQNLVAKIPDEVSYEEAAFVTIGAIALQGVRQTEPQLGENICVIGLGLIGQITAQLVRSSGANVFGIDLDSKLVELAAEHSCDKALIRNDSNLLELAKQFTDGYGFDKVIITAATASNDPIELSAEISRKKGKVIVVGAVGMTVPRDPHFYRKELDLKMSCSYGPGRYDPQYEELGVDYPIGYVRWTEQRNMEAFLNAVAKKQVNLKPLITHNFDIDQADKAYELVINPDAEFNLGVLLAYQDREGKLDQVVFEKTVKSTGKENPQVSFIGAGSFAQSYLIPNIEAVGGALYSVLTNKGINSGHVAQKFGFTKAESEPSKIFEDENNDVVFIATRHDTHSEYATQCLRNNKHVFVEKPLALNTEELNEVIDAERISEGNLMVGFNRRFSKAAKLVKKHFKGSESTLAFNFRVNAGELPAEHWTQNEELGGGRIIGEVCHFIDLMSFFTNSYPLEVFAQSLPGLSDQKKNDDTVLINIKFTNGSIGSISYLSNGDKSVPKELLEIYGGTKTAIIHDFKYVTLHEDNKAKKVSTPGKGQREEVEAFIKSIQGGNPSPISVESIHKTTLTTFKILDSIATGLPQQI